jgi:hypothetical protein
MKKSKNTLENKKPSLVLEDTEQNTILANLIDGNLVIDEAKRLKISLKTLYDYLEQNQKFKDQFLKAQEIGMKTLVELLLKAFNQEYEEVDSNKLLFLREKKDYLKWLAPRVSSFFQEKQKVDIKQDTHITYGWQSEPIDINAVVEEVEGIENSTPSKD